jgi:D-psicose/D-tagatose/L-ribulose 3-epimerase
MAAMIRRSISNLAWPSASPIEEIAPQLKSAGMDGVELAPTAIWPHAPSVPARDVRAYARRWREHGLTISGIQSLLFGHPDLQVFDSRTWPEMYKHLTAMTRLAHDLDTNIAVFGSPKNRARGDLTDQEANAICAEFLTGLLPVLADCGVVLTLEPNAPSYGADFLTHYADTVALSDLLGSAWVQPQVDTGCLTMVNDDPVRAVRSRTPAHVHVSTPNLLPPPGPVDHQALWEALVCSGYDGWLVLEMLQSFPEPLEVSIRSARWLTEAYGPTQS